ncbi:MAG: dethiobiotin synthase [Thermodesulfobacteriota bacterium]
MQNLPKAIFVSGTDTSVGKTVVTALLALCLKKAGKKVGVLKPFQTGTETEPFLDIEFIYNALEEDYNLDEVCPLRLKKALSPYSAAKIENFNIPLEEIINHCRNFIFRNEITLIEGAGGLYVPITNNYTMADIAADLDLPIVLVARPGLGTINHTLLSVEHIRKKKLNLLGIVINNFKNNFDLASITNLDVFKNLYKLNIIGVVPSFSSTCMDNYFTDKVKATSDNYFSYILGGCFEYEKFVDKF